MEPDYEACREGMEGAGGGLDPAEVHGLLCGLLGARGESGVATWLEELGLDPQRAEPPLQEALAALLRHAVEGLRSPELGFSPLLPGDEVGLEGRVGALGAWCRGYLYGLGIGGIGERSALPPECRELLADLAELARLEGRDAGGEGDEWPFAELVEYLRVGVQLIHVVLEEARGAPSASHGHEEGG